MIDSGGMPSSHSATVTALAVAIGLQEGTEAPEFAIAVVLACIVCVSCSVSRISKLLHSFNLPRAIVRPCVAPYYVVSNFCLFSNGAIHAP